MIVFIWLTWFSLHSHFIGDSNYIKLSRNINNYKVICRFFRINAHQDASGCISPPIINNMQQSAGSPCFTITVLLALFRWSLISKLDGIASFWFQIKWNEASKWSYPEMPQWHRQINTVESMSMCRMQGWRYIKCPMHVLFVLYVLV